MSLPIDCMLDSVIRIRMAIILVWNSWYLYIDIESILDITRSRN